MVGLGGVVNGKDAQGAHTGIVNEPVTRGSPWTVDVSRSALVGPKAFAVLAVLSPNSHRLGVTWLLSP